MRIAALTLHGSAGWPSLAWDSITPGMNVVHGRPGTGKSAIADLMVHAIYGSVPQAISGFYVPNAPQGEVLVEAEGGRYRLRRYLDASAVSRLTVAALDGSAVTAETVRGFLHGLSPALLRHVFAVRFHEPPQVERLLAADIAKEFQTISGGPTQSRSRRLAELASRRDALAQELETRIAGERRASHELDQQWRELERLIGEEKRASSVLEQRFRAVENALAETDARLRYRRLELNAEQQWRATEPSDWEMRLAELDEQIARWRVTLGELAAREASVRARLAQIQPGLAAADAATTDQQSWLAVARQLAADLSGEVARLARASTSQQCVCRDSHPRLRPIVEAFERQLDVLTTLVDQQRRAATAADLMTEAEDLGRSQSELRRQIERLIDRRQSLTRSAHPSRQRFAANQAEVATSIDVVTSDKLSGSFTVADAEQLEQRRMELEQERFNLVNRLAMHAEKLRELRSQRTAVDRQRAALLSARSIEHIQRELATVQQKLEQTASSGGEDGWAAAVENPLRASDYLAQLTDGRLVRLQLVEGGRRACVVNRAGETVKLDALTAAERDLVYLSFCLALASTASRQGVQLPLVLDDPFVRQDARGMAALAAVLDDFSRQGNQVLVFTAQAVAAERLASLGAPVQDIVSLRQREREVAAVVPKTPTTSAIANEAPVVPKKLKTRRIKEGRKPKKAEQTTEDRAEATHKHPSNSDHSDAA